MDTVETTESVEAPAEAGVPASTPEAGEDSQSSEKLGGEVEVQLSPKAQQRMQRLANEAKEAKRWKSEFERLQSQFKEAEGAINIDKWLRADQKRAAAFVQWMQQQENPQPQEDPYAKYNPEIQELAKTASELRAWKEQQELSERQRQEQEVISNQTKLEDHFENLLKEKGFADEKGYIEEGVSNALGEAVLARLAKSIGDPRIANEKQLNDALDGVIKDLSFLERRALKGAVKQPNIPASGTRTGKVASQKIDYSNPDNRIAFLANAMKG